MSLHSMPLFTPSSPSTTSTSDMSVGKMQIVHFHNEYPYDDQQLMFRELLAHSKDRGHPVLAHFLDEATHALREEIRLLPVALKNIIPPFESVLNWVEFTDLRKSQLNGSVEGVLLIILELGIFIGYLEDHPNDFKFNNSVDYALTGMGVGLLAASAVTMAGTLSDLALTGAQAIRQAFRLGVMVNDFSQNLHPAEPGSPPTDSWAYVLANVSPEQVTKELDLIQQQEKIPEASKIFLSAVSATSVTISGPPSRLKELFRSKEFFRDAKSIALPVYSGLCHAGHIYGHDSVRQVVHNDALAAMERKLNLGLRVPLYSTSTGRPFKGKTATQLLENIVTEVLTEAIKWGLVIEGVVQQAADSGAAQVQLTVFRNSLPVQELLTYAKENLSPEVMTRHEEIVPWLHNLEPATGVSGPRGPMQSKIAIVGMACRLPGGADTTDKFWDLLEAGLDVSMKHPADRWDVDKYFDPTGKRNNSSATPYGCFINEPGLFDAPFFNMSPREAEQIDPMQRLALVTAYEALERSGYVANRTQATKLERIGTFYGQGSDDYREVNAAQEISTYFIPGGCRAFGPGRINYFFKFAGPSYDIDTACSSSLATIQTACTSLWNGDCDTVVAGGLNVLSNPDGFAGLCNGHFLSKTPGACKTWDVNADGYCRADAIGSIVLKRLDDAVADNDNILGVIAGAGTNHSAEAISITHPHAGHQGYLGRLVLGRAGIDPLSVSFVEMHGTGTQAGDFEEIQSVSDTYAPRTRHRSPKKPLYIGAVKSNVGHSEAAAGVTALMKVLLMMQKNAIPPHVGIKTALTPKFPKDLDARGVRIPMKKVDWHRPAGSKRVAVVNNFSAAGGNSTVIIEDGPLREIERPDPRPSHVVAVSAKGKASFKGNLERLIAYLEASPDVSIADLGYTTTARRAHYNYRTSCTAGTAQHAIKQLRSTLDAVNEGAHKAISNTGTPAIAFAFTGQGASFKSYSLELYHDSEYFRSQIQYLDNLARIQGFPSFIPVLDGSFDKEHQHSAVTTQLAQTCTQIALAHYWEQIGIKPDVVVGHSLGEYAALCVAGVVSASDAIYLVGSRARLLEERCKSGSHKMVAVRASVEQIQAASQGKPYEIACINGPKETVLSGLVAEMDAIIPLLEKEGHKCFSLDVAFAFHSAQMDPIVDDFEAATTRAVIFRAPQLPIISPLLSKVVFDDKTINAKYLRRGTRETVNFVAALQSAVEIGTVDDETVWVEIGPHPVAVNFVKNTLGFSSIMPSLRRGENNWTTMASSLSTLHNQGIKVEWSEFHRPFETSLRLLDLPTYAWNEKNYWIMYKKDWCLTKGNDHYDNEVGAQLGIESAKPPQAAGAAAAGATTQAVSSLSTSLVQQIISEEFDVANGTAKVTMQSDLMHPEFRAAAWGHKMNNCGVVTSSIHGDIAYTLGKYAYNKLKPKNKAEVHMNVGELEVLKGLVAKNKPDAKQLIQVTLTISDLDTKTAELEWRSVNDDGVLEEDAFASATVTYGDAKEWLNGWVPMQHFIQGRIEELERLAAAGVANRLNRNMAYLMFANNLVDYAEKYRGMQSLVMNGLEAFADVTLTTDKGGSFTVPPHFLDSVGHLAGFVMNVSDAIDTKTYYCVTPGWRSLRIAKPLVPGGKYRSYVKMIPTAEDPGTFLGDVYILQDGEVIGLCGGIKFCRYPRLLLSRFFSAPDDPKAAPVAVATSSKKQAPAAAPKKVQAAPPAPAPKAPAPEPKVEAPKVEKKVEVAAPEPAKAAAPPPAEAAPAPATDSTTAKALQIIADESALDLEELTDEASFAELGIDSLMSLVIAEKFREHLNVTVNGSLFLEYPTIGDLRAWLEEYYG